MSDMMPNFDKSYGKSNYMIIVLSTELSLFCYADISHDTPSVGW